MPSGKCQVTGEFFVSLDEHHIIPQEYGGTNGPTIYLRPDIHQAIHRVAKNPATKDEFFSSLNPKSRQLVDMLIRKIIEHSVPENKLTTDKTISVKIPHELYFVLKTKAKDLNVSLNNFVIAVLKQYVNRS